MANCRNERNATITDSESFKFNTKITGKTSAAGNKRMLKDYIVNTDKNIALLLMAL